jgi:hypothetical protein
MIPDNIIEERNKAMIPEDSIYKTGKEVDENGQRIGTCAQASIAYVTGHSIAEVLSIWKFKHHLKFENWSNWRDIRKYLENEGYVVKYRKLPFCPLDVFVPHTLIARVQWIGDGDNKDKPFYGYPHWSEATRHTHFIAIQQGYFFCNTEGEKPIKNLAFYLLEGDGVITSLMEITKTNGGGANSSPE